MQEDLVNKLKVLIYYKKNIVNMTTNQKLTKNNYLMDIY